MRPSYPLYWELRRGGTEKYSVLEIQLIKVQWLYTKLVVQRANFLLKFFYDQI